MPALTGKHKALVSRILDGEGSASRSDRRNAFDDAGLEGPIEALISKVATHPSSVTDADITAVRASGLSEDQIFEMVVSAAIGQATRQYNSALAALDAAATKE